MKKKKYPSVNLYCFKLWNRNSIMAPATDSSYKERKGSCRPVPVDIQGYHRTQTAHRDRRHQGR